LKDHLPANNVDLLEGNFLVLRRGFELGKVMVI
jgi:hypothetical protein